MTCIIQPHASMHRFIDSLNFILKWLDNIGPLSALPSLLLSADIRVEYRRPAPPWRGNVCSERLPSSRAPTLLSSTEAEDYQETLSSSKKQNQVHVQTVQERVCSSESLLLLYVNHWNCCHTHTHIWEVTEIVKENKYMIYQTFRNDFDNFSSCVEIKNSISWLRFHLDWLFTREKQMYHLTPMRPSVAGNAAQTSRSRYISWFFLTICG